MMLVLYFAALAGCIVLDLKTGIRRPLLLLSLPLLILDCAANCLICMQSWRNTMSGEAWNHRDDKWWRWTHRAIDALFFWQDSHCQRQAIKEAAHGGFWPAYADDWKHSRREYR